MLQVKETLCSPMHLIDNLLRVHDTMPHIDSTQGENAPSNLVPPSKRVKVGQYSEKEIQSAFQATNFDTFGVNPHRLKGKKRGRTADDGDGFVSYRTIGNIIEIGNYRGPLSPPPPQHATISSVSSSIFQPENTFTDC